MGRGFCVIHANAAAVAPLTPASGRLGIEDEFAAPPESRLPPRANVLPIVGCPAIGSSSPGVKIRIRAPAPVSTDERALRKFLAGDRLHHPVVRPAGSGRPKLVPFVGRAGEDVDVQVAIAWVALISCRGPGEDHSSNGQRAPRKIHSAFQHGRLYGTIRATNPFLAEP